MNAAFAQVTQALFIVVDILLEVSGLGLDMFVYGYTFYYRPAQTYGFNHFFPFLDFLYCPYFPVWNMMQGVYNAGSPGLFDVPKAYRVVGTVPAPGLFTKNHVIYCLMICNLLFTWRMR